MSLIANRRGFLLKSAAVVATGSTLAACGGSDTSAPAQFTYGVASGDPLATSVILWTYAKTTDSTAPVALTWQIASDMAFTAIVNSGSVVATEASAFTAKVDATGLVAGNTYYYRFKDASGATSPVGTTRTLPAANASQVKLAVFSCSLYPQGYFNVYAEAANSDAQYALHLGDYIYEYGAAGYGSNGGVPGRTAQLSKDDIVTLADYRARYALYKSDPDLQAVHAKMPWITIWDDHEFANNAYVNGAENHDSSKQGDWVTRKNIAAKVYHEWMPIRTPDPLNLLKIYRSFDFGNLLSLHMLDTRIEGRDRQYDNYGDKDGGIARYIAGTTKTNGITPDASRQMMSGEQQNWLKSKLTSSTATWQFLGNQDIMARMWFPATVLQAFGTGNLTAVNAAVKDFLDAKATNAAAGAAALTPTQAGLLSAANRLPYNLDSWDGYPANRDALLNDATGKNLVVLSGDSHNGWFNNLTKADGTKVGVEFATSSVTAPGFESAGLGSFAPYLDGSGTATFLKLPTTFGTSLGLVDDINYADSTRRGYLVMTVTAASVKGEYVYVDTIASKTYKATVGKTITVPKPATNGTVGAVTYA